MGLSFFSGGVDWSEGLKVIGRLYRQSTGVLATWAGVKAGRVLTMRRASASRSGDFDLTTLASVIVPSFLTMNWTMTFPLMPASRALWGYLMWDFIHSYSASWPPGNVGGTSTLLISKNGFCSGSTTSPIIMTGAASSRALSFLTAAASVAGGSSPSLTLSGMVSLTLSAMVAVMADCGAGPAVSLCEAGPG